jgi:hypothetical protein
MLAATPLTPPLGPSPPTVWTRQADELPMPVRPMRKRAPDVEWQPGPQLYTTYHRSILCGAPVAPRAWFIGPGGADP